MDNTTAMDMTAVREVSLAINAAHRFVYFIPEAGEEYGALGSTSRGGSYFAARSAPLGPITNEVIIATFYNFAPRAVNGSMDGLWDIASPAQWQAARFRSVSRGMARVGVALPDADVAEARSLIDPVVSLLDLAGKPLAAANAALPLPEEPTVALWQQITTLREWRGDAHIIVLGANQIGPCDCNVMQTGTGRFPLALAKASRQWNDDEWSAASDRLAARGWVDSDGAVTDAGRAARDRIEDETDALCAPIWTPIGNAGARRLAQLISPINEAFVAAGTYAAM